MNNYLGAFIVAAFFMLSSVSAFACCHKCTVAGKSFCCRCSPQELRNSGERDAAHVADEAK